MWCRYGDQECASVSEIGMKDIEFGFLDSLAVFVLPATPAGLIAEKPNSTAREEMLLS